MQRKIIRSRTSPRKTPRKGLTGFIANKYDKFEGKELLELWERARQKLEVVPVNIRLFNIIVNEITLIESSKNWKP